MNKQAEQLEKVLGMMVLNTGERYIQVHNLKDMTNKELDDLITFTDDLNEFKEINDEAYAEYLLNRN